MHYRENESLPLIRYAKQLLLQLQVHQLPFQDPTLQFQLIQPFQPNLDSGGNIFFLACRAQIPASEFTAEVGEAFSMPMYGNRPTRIPVLLSLAASTFIFCMWLNISTNGKLHRFWQLFLKQIQLKWGAAP